MLNRLPRRAIILRPLRPIPDDSSEAKAVSDITAGPEMDTGRSSDADAPEASSLHTQERDRLFSLLPENVMALLTPTAVQRGAYDGVVHAGRSAVDGEAVQEAFRVFLAQYPNSTSIMSFLQRLGEKTQPESLPKTWRFTAEGGDTLAEIDWLAVATGPRERDGELAERIRDHGFTLAHEYVSIIITANLKEAIRRILDATGCAGWARDRLAVEILRTCKQTAAELVLDIPDERAESRMAVEKWLSGEVPLWRIGRRSLPFTDGPSRAGEKDYLYLPSVSWEAGEEDLPIQ